MFGHRREVEIEKKLLSLLVELQFESEIDDLELLSLATDAEAADSIEDVQELIDEMIKKKKRSRERFLQLIGEY